MTEKETILKALDLVEVAIEGGRYPTRRSAKAYGLTVEDIEAAKIYIFNQKNEAYYADRIEISGAPIEKGNIK